MTVASTKRNTTSSTSNEKNLNEYSLIDVEKHNKEEDGWMVVDNEVYNVSSFLKMHPGGRDIMLNYLGKDVTQQFKTDEFHSHSTRAHRILQKYIIGRVAGTGGSTADTHPLANLVDFEKPVLPQVVKMNPKLYQNWIHGASSGTTTFRIFEMTFFEMCSRWPWWYILPTYLPLAAFLFYSAINHVGLLKSAVVFPLGFLSWGLFEYIMHRWLFHVNTDSTHGNFYHFFAHGIHHLTPLDSSRLTFPPTFGIVMAYSLYSSLIRLLPYVSFIEAMMSGFVFGYVSYDTLHYFFHQEHQFKWFPYFGYMKRRHNRHHYKTPNMNFGVTTPIFDWVWGTSAK